MADKLVIAGSDTSELFELAEEALDAVAFLVEARITGMFDRPVGPWRDDGLGADVAQGLVEVVGVVRLVSDDGGGPEAIEQSGRLDDVAAVARGQDEADG